MGHTTTAAKWRNVARLLSDYDLSYRTRLNMGRGYICDETTKDGGCETVSCFAGHYMMAITPDDARGKGKNNYWYDLEGYDLHYLDGIDAITDHLGFESSGHFKQWLMFHPDIWGNKNGGLIFEEPRAFFTDEVKTEDEVTVAHIVSFLHKVADRLEERERA